MNFRFYAACNGKCKGMGKGKGKGMGKGMGKGKGEGRGRSKGEGKGKVKGKDLSKGKGSKRAASMHQTCSMQTFGIWLWVFLILSSETIDSRELLKIAGEESSCGGYPSFSG